MRRHFIVLLLMSGALTICSGGAFAADCASVGAGPGDICIVLQDELGNPIAGDVDTVVEFLTEGSDGSLSNPNVQFDLYDGHANDSSGSPADGVILVTAAQLASWNAFNFANPAPYDWRISVTSASGFVKYPAEDLFYSQATVNTASADPIQLEYSLHVSLVDELGAPIDSGGGQIEITGFAACNGIYRDGVPGEDNDGVEDGEIYVLCPVVNPTAIGVEVTADGFTDFDIPAVVISRDTQALETTSQQYTLKINSGDIEDFLANTITPADAADVSGWFTESTTTVAKALVDGGDVYIAADGAGDLTIRYTGYLEKTIAVTPVTTAQTTVAYTGADGLDHQIIVNYGAGNLEDELGGALAFDAGDTFVVSASCGGAAIPHDAVEDGASWYIAPETAPGALYVTISRAGYVDTCDNSTVTTSWAAADSPAFEPGDSDGLPFTVKVVVEDELGNPITGATAVITGGETAIDGGLGDGDGMADGVIYIAQDPAALGAGPHEITVSKAASGFIEWVDATKTISATAQTEYTTANEYTVKVTALEDELGNTLTGATVTSGAGGAVACVEPTVADGSYYCAVPDGETSEVTAAMTGYIENTAATLGGADEDGAQLVQDMSDGTGSELLFTVMVSALEDELGNTLTGATVTSGAGGAVVCVEPTVADGSYYCAVPDGQTSAVTAGKTGYITDMVGTAGAAAEAGPQRVQDMSDGTGSELLFTVTVTALEDELGNTLTGATVTSGAGGAVACVEPSVADGSYYCAVPDGQTSDVSASKSGYITGGASGLLAAAEAGPQRAHDMSDGSGDELLYTLKIPDLQNEIGDTLLGATVTSGTGGAVVCDEPAAPDGSYYCAVPNGQTTAATAALDGYITRAAATVGNADEGGAQLLQNMTDGSGKELLFTVKATIENEVGDTITGATVDSGAGGAVACLEEAVPDGNYYCAVPDGETSEVIASFAGYVTRTAATMGNANVGGSQLVQDMTDGGGKELQFTVAISPLQDEIGGILTGATVTSGAGGAILCVEESVPDGNYFCPVPDGQTSDATAVKSGYITGTSLGLGNAAEAGPQLLHDMSMGSGDELLFTVVVTTLENEVGAEMNGATVASGAGAAVSCSQKTVPDGNYYCAVPNGETSEVVAGKSGYVNRTKVSIGNAAAGGPQRIHDMTDGSGSELLFTVKVSTLEDELGNTLTGATIRSGDLADIVCVEEAAPDGNYFCAVPDGQSSAVVAAKPGYVTENAATLGAAAAGGPQRIHDMTDGSGGELLFTVKVTSLQDELGNLQTGAAVTSGTGGAVVCVEDGVPDGSYYCAVPSGQTSEVAALVDGYAKRTAATLGNASASGPQREQIMSDGTGKELLFTVKATLEDELGNVITGATVASGAGGAIACAEEAAPDGNYYCAVPWGQTSEVSAASAGYVTSTAATLGNASDASQLLQDMTEGTAGELLFTVKVSALENELGDTITGATVTSGAGGAVACFEPTVADGSYYCPVPDGQTSAVTAVYAGYITGAAGTLGAAAEAGPQRAQDMSAGTAGELQFTVIVSALEDELGNTITGATVTSGAGGAVGCVEPAVADGSYYCAVPNGATSATTAAKTGYITGVAVDIGNASAAGPQRSQDMSAGMAGELQFTVMVSALEDELGNPLTGATVTSGAGGAVACVEPAAPDGSYYCAVPDGATSDVTAAKAGYVTGTSTGLGNANESGAQLSHDMSDGTGGELLYTVKVTALENEVGDTLTGATVTSGAGGAVVCVEDAVPDGSYYCAVPNGGTSAVTAAITGHVTGTVASAGAADESGIQIEQDLSDSSGDELLLTLKVTLEDELGNPLTGAAVTSGAGGAVACVEDLVPDGSYYCAVPDGETTATEASLGGYVTMTALTLGGAAEAGPQLVQNMVAGTGEELPYTVKVSMLEDELGNPITGATVTSGAGGAIVCVEPPVPDGSYYCAVPDGETSAVTASLAGYVTATAGTLGNADESGAPLVQDMSAGTAGELLFTVKVSALEDELANPLTGATATSGAGGAVACVEPAVADGSYYCAVPDSEISDVSAAKSGYITGGATGLAVASESGPQREHDMSDGTGNELQFTVIVSALEDETGNALMGATVTSGTSGAVACVEPAAPDGSYYCAVPDGETSDATASIAGYVTGTSTGLGNADESGAQLDHDMSDGSGGELLYTVKVSPLQNEVGDTLIGATVTSGAGGAIACVEDIVPDGNYFCAVPDGETSAVTAAIAGHVTRTAATMGAADEGGAQLVQDMSDGNGEEMLFTVKVALEDEVGGAVIGATVSSGDGALVACVEDIVPDGFYYCAVPDAESSEVEAAAAGYITTTAATAGPADENGSQIVQSLVDGSGEEMLFTVKLTILEDELGNTLTGAAVTSGAGGAVACVEDVVPDGAYYCAVPNGETSALAAAKTGFITGGAADNGAANESGAQVLQDMSDGTGDELLFTVMLTALEDELGNSLTGATVTSGTGGAIACVEPAVADGSYFCAVPDGETSDVSAAITGYITGGATGLAVASESGPQRSQDMSDGTGDELLFTVIVTALEDELGATLTGATVTSGASGAIACEEPAVPDGSYFCAVPDGETSAVTAALDGYITHTAATLGGADENGAQLAQDMSDATGDELLFTVKASVENELGDTLTGATVTSGTGGATACLEDGVPDGFYYCAVPNGQTSAVTAALIGYITSTRTSAGNVNVGGSQMLQDMTDGSGDELLYVIRIDAAQEELGNAVDIEAGDVATLYNTAGCSGLEAPLDPPAYDAATEAWYIRIAPGSYYTRFSKTGYVDACDATAAVAAAAGPQAIPTFTLAGGDPLRYGLRVKVYDEYDRPITNATLTHGGLPPVHANIGVEANNYYFDTAGAAGLVVAKQGYQTINQTTAGRTTEPGGGAVKQTSLTLTGKASGSLEDGDIVAAPAGTVETRNGLRLLNNVKLTLEYDNGVDSGGLLGLGSLTNFYFLSATGSRVIPSAFIEVDPVNLPGEYHFRVPGTTASVQVKDVDYNDNPWIDLVDSAVIPLAGLDELSLHDYGTVTMYPRADHVELTADASFFAAATSTVSIAVRDNKGNIITVGPHAALKVRFSMTGGSASPPSLKDITDTSLDNASNISGAADTSLTGEVAAGVGSVDIFDSVVSGATPILLSAEAADIVLPQNFAANTANLAIDVEHAAAHKVVIHQPANVTTDDVATVTIEIQDESGNVVESGTQYPKITLTGSALISSVVTGTRFSPIGADPVDEMTIETDNGRIVIEISDTVAETTAISVSNVLLELPAPVDLTFAHGAPAAVVITDVSHATQSAGDDVSVEIEIHDANGNLATSSEPIFTVTAVGDGNNTAKFTAATTGDIVSGVNTHIAAVKASGGIVVLTLTDESAETVEISLEDSAGVGPAWDWTSTDEVEFFQSGIDYITVDRTTVTLTAGQLTPAIVVSVFDEFGNPATGRAADLTVAIDSTSDQGLFYTTDPAGAAVTSITIPAAGYFAHFYYYDTKAGAATITMSAAGADNVTTQATVNPAAPINAVTVTTSCGNVDASQPTGFTCKQEKTINAQTFNLVEYPRTATDSYEYQIVADGHTRGVIKLLVVDQYGNAIAGEDVNFVVSGLTGASVSPASATTDADGKITAEITSTAVGSALVRADLADYAYDYGVSFTATFKADDRTPPTIARFDSKTLVDGDYVDALGPIVISVVLDDPGVNAVGINLADAGAITVAVKAVAGGTVNGVTNKTGCDSELELSDCVVSWEPFVSMTAGSYEATLTVKDRNGNEQKQAWTVVVEGSAALKDVLAGPGVFDPRSGQPMTISFQSSEAGAVVTLEIYNRSGQLIHRDVLVADAGYNYFEWAGRTLYGNLPGNGIYIFRLTANMAGQVTSQTGKLAVFKP